MESNSHLYSNENDFIEEEYNVDKSKTPAATLVDKILLSRPLKAIIAIFIMAVIIPALLYGLLYSQETVTYTYGTCIILPEYWSDCFPGRETNQTICVEDAKCCWNSTYNFCYHTIPSEHSYKSKIEGENILESRQRNTPFNLTPHEINYSKQSTTSDHLSITLTNANNIRKINNNGKADGDIQIEEDLNDAFMITLFTIQNNTREVLFTTKSGPLIASEGYWEISMEFSKAYKLYGSGASKRNSLRFTPSNITLYNGIKSTTSGRNFILSLNNESGSSHGVLFESPGAIELVIRKSNLITIRSTTNTSLVLHTFKGTTPTDVISKLYKYTINGNKPNLPDWIFGIHMCRDNARGNITQFYDFNNVLNITDYWKFPYDSDCIDDSTFSNISFDLNPNRVEHLKSALKELEGKKKFIYSLFAQVATKTSAYQQFSFINYNSTTKFNGKHRGYSVGYPDYFNDNSVEILKSQLNALFENIYSKFLPHGFALQDNWPLNENYMIHQEDDIVFVPYDLNNTLSNGTILWNATYSDGSLHHTMHSMYGQKHGERCIEYMKNENINMKPVVFTSSKSSNINNQQTIWLGVDQPPTWHGFKSSLMSVLESSISGDSIIGGGSICGSKGDWSDSLCTHWSLLSIITYPIARYYHSWKEPCRDISNMTDSTIRVITRAAKLRYKLLPYTLTLVNSYIQNGEPILRPMFIDFYYDKNTWDLEEQFMYGDSIMIVPTLNPITISLNIYLPSNTNWYTFLGGELLTTNNNNTATLLISPYFLTMLIRSGKIVLMQDDSGSDVEETLSKSREIFIALDETQNAAANVLLYEDIFIDLTSDNTSLTISSLTKSCDISVKDKINTKISKITIFNGISPNPFERPNATVQINGIDVISTVEDYDEITKKFSFKFDGVNIIDWCNYTSDEIIIEWIY